MMKLLLVTSCALILIWGCGSCRVSAAAEHAASERNLPELSRSAIAESVPAAREALPQLAPLVREETFRNLGFDSIEDIKQAQLGAPLHFYMVRLDRLQQFESKSKTEAMLSETNEVLFPVLVSERVRSGLKMRLDDGKWRFGSFGASAATKALADTSRKVAATSKMSVELQFAVRVPAYHLYFIGHHDAHGELILTSAGDDARFKLEAGHSAPAQDVFATLAAFAKQYKAGERLVD